MLDKNVISYIDFGTVKFKLAKIMKERKISVYELSTKADIPFNTVKKWKIGEDVTRINTDTISKLCYVLECEISDLMEYQKPKE